MSVWFRILHETEYKRSRKIAEVLLHQSDALHLASGKYFRVVQKIGVSKALYLLCEYEDLAGFILKLS